MNVLEGVPWQAETTFWLLFFFFNFSVFVFLPIINFKPRYLIPFQSLPKKRLGALFFSFNPDCYRICVDLSLIILFYRWFKIDQGMVLASVYYSMILTYNIYHYSFSKIYQVYPIISNDFRLIMNTGGILWAESRWKVIIFTTSGILSITGLSYGFLQALRFSHALPFNTFFYIATSLVTLYAVAGLWRYGIYRPKSDSAMRVMIMPLRISYNIINSWKLVNRLRKTNLDQLGKVRNLKLNLIEKPNIYCLFIESYGSILLKEEKLRPQFTEDFNHFKESLNKANWKTHTNFSESISPVGPSWLAYTSVIFGSKVTNNFEYEFLLNKEALYPYNTLMKVFMKEGYTSYHLNATQPKAGVMIPYQQMTSFFGIDEWILAKDIAYSGPLYGYAESPADQYVLNVALEKIKAKKEENPFILFYLTKNSHTPFVSPHQIAPDWKTLNNGKNENFGNRFLQKPTFEDYQKAITYQLKFLEDYILKQGSKNDIFLLIGDHQPHVLSKHEKYGKETLVHVISQNHNFVEGFREYGFQESIENFTQPIKHEAIYSMFVREVIKNFGEAGTKIPPYEANGIIF